MATKQKIGRTCMSDSPHPRKRDDERCLRELAREAIAVTAVFAMLSAFSENADISARRVATFFALYVGVTWFLQKTEFEFAQQMVRVVGFQLGTKLFSVLTG